MWKIEYTKRFLKELSKIPKEVQAKAENIVFEELLSCGIREMTRSHYDNYSLLYSLKSF